MKEGKKRKSFLRQIARKAARVSSSQEVSKSAADDDEEVAVEARVETPVPPKSCELKDHNTPTSDPCARSSVEGNESMGWNCEKCTLLNSINRKRCEACEARRPIMTSCPSTEELNSPLSRSLYSAPAKLYPLQVQGDTSINIKLVEKLETPKTSKINGSPMLIENCSSHQRASRTELDNNGRNPLPSPRDTNENECSEQNDDKGGNVFQSIRARLSSTVSKENKLSDRGECKDRIHHEECANTVENGRQIPTSHDRETPHSANEDYQQLQDTLVRVLDELDSMNKLIHTQKDEIQSLREQNGDILLAQEQLLNENRKMRVSLLALETAIYPGRSHLEPEGASLSNDALSSVSSETGRADDANVLTSGVLLGEIKAASSGTKRSHKLNGSKSALEPALNAVNLDDLQCEENVERLSTLTNREEIEASTSHSPKETPKESEKLLLAPPSPAASTQTIDPDANSQASAPSKVFASKKSLPDRLLKNRTNQNLPQPVPRPWMSNKNSRQFLVEMENAAPRQESAPWMTTRSKLTSTAPFRSLTDLGQDPLFDEPNYAYKETVRCHKDRSGLPCHDCDECRQWYQTLKNTGHEFSQDPLEFSRHRSRFQPHESPVDFWEMSFVDERIARKAEEAGTSIKSHH